MDPFVGEIRLMSFSYAPRDWADCDGAIVQVSQNQALAVLLGATFGGSWPNTFALPDLRGRIPVMPDNQTVMWGSTGGSETVALTAQQMPSHTHTAIAATAEGTQSNPTGQFPAPGNGMNWIGPKGTAPLTTMAPGVVATSGAGAGHENRMPSIAMSYCIATAGLFPPRQ